ncbi:hypothetical protein DCAR_0415009 [Daucus carota subsp. sativus]|uniref:Uncharacterized protein n=1 Tax=Daucus carota subsp. sativus TaxID=79200 RepID=A0A165A569_DAUCS|nr:hypothetical protein DCAR_0415009 [Daucus carota subsp. sativus]
MTYDKKGDFCFSAGSSDGLKKYKSESSAEAEKRGREKGKAKIMHEFCFNDDGLLSQEALNLLDGGNLHCFSGAPLDSLVGNGV